MKNEVILAGSGGQGLVLGGIILGQAAMLEGKNVVQTQSYGIATRGGFSKSEVIISDDEIIFQQVQKPDVILTLTQETMDMYHTYSDSLVLYDSDLVKSSEEKKLHGFPFTKLAIELGYSGALNIIALGLISSLTQMVSLESLQAIIKQRFGKKSGLSLKALEKGTGLAASLQERKMINQ